MSNNIHRKEIVFGQTQYNHQTVAVVNMYIESCCCFNMDIIHSAQLGYTHVFTCFNSYFPWIRAGEKCDVDSLELIYDC
jgi:hypothetical protein